MAKKSNTQPEIKSIRSSFLGRGLSLARIGLKAGWAVSRGRGSPEAMREALAGQITDLTRELGELKGSLMKVGQLLSMYGEHFLPKDANQILKSLQFQSPAVAWPVMRKALVKELGEATLAGLEIDPKPWASASLGQVHRARHKGDGRELAIKIQYPGVERAIDNDLKVLKAILSLLQITPKGARFDEVFEEVREMLHQEVDYRQEAKFTTAYGTWLKDDPRYLIPEVLPEFSSGKVLTTTFMVGETVDGPAVAALSQQRRNRMGAAFLELYLRELLEFRQVQTDPHLGNYRIAIDPNGQDKLILLDYGAIRAVPAEFLKNYLALIRGGIDQRPEEILRGGRGLGLLLNDDPVQLLQKYIQMCFLITEPFAKPETHFAPASLMTDQGVYDWGASDLPGRVAKQAADVAFSFRLRAPPREIVFLDRKLGGTFVFLSVLKCQLNAREILMPLLKSWPTP